MNNMSDVKEGQNQKDWGQWFLCLLISLPLSLCIWGGVVQWEAEKQLMTHGREARDRLLTLVEQVGEELDAVIREATPDCNDHQIQHLREDVFRSQHIKEVGVFDAQYRIYCTDLGSADFYLYQRIQQRITDNPLHQTLSFIRSKIVGQPTVFVFRRSPEGKGANGLLQPASLTSLLDDVLSSQNMSYRLNITGKSLGEMDDRQNWINRLLPLENWPMSLEIGFPKSVMLSLLQQRLPSLLIIWLGVTLLSGWVWARYLRYRRSLGNSLKYAIRQRRLHVYFQPIVDTRSQEIVGLEALLRWRHPLHGRIPPNLVIEMASRLGLMEPLTWLVFDEVAGFLTRNEERLGRMPVAMNIHRSCFLLPEFADKVALRLRQQPSLVGRIGFEVTEDSAFSEEEMPTALAQFHRLRQMGVRLAVDDFGTGYSGLDFVRRFPFDYLKVDQVFVRNLLEDRMTIQVMDAIVRLAGELNMSLVAEGVEEETQLSRLTSMGIFQIQGFYFAKAMSEPRLLQWLSEFAISRVVTTRADVVSVVKTS